MTHTVLKKEELTPARFLKEVFTDEENQQILKTSPVVVIHLIAFGALPFVGFSWVALLVCVFTYLVRVFALTAGFHRYFSHRSFRTSRVFQFLLALVGTSAGQLGPLWWASHHRHHHEHSDTEQDVHSPRVSGFLWSHVGWILSRRYQELYTERVGDLARYPELRFIDRFHFIAPWTLGFALFFLGNVLAVRFPSLGTSGWQLVIWGFFLSTVAVYHVTFCVNSVTHMFGNKRFATRDDSRNNFWLALLTMGEGWHNNHHRYPVSARQGLYWWEIDITYYVLRLFEKLGIVWGLHTHPAIIYAEAERAAERRVAHAAGEKPTTAA